MAGPKSDFLRIAKERGYIHQTSDEAELDAALNKGGWSRISATTAPPTACMSAT